jgi:ABC-type uncharacterized transport system substrate-binding protein
MLLVDQLHALPRCNGDGRLTSINEPLAGMPVTLPAPRLQLQVVRANNSRELDAAFATAARERADALFAGSDGMFVNRRVQLANLTSRHTLPATFHSREIVEAGGLMSYGSDIADAFRQAGVYAGRIINGANPADLPVVQSSKFAFVINQQTARMLGLIVPPSLLATADEVIE